MGVTAFDVTNMLTRPQFDAACKALIAQHTESTSDSAATSPLRGWAWNEHPSYPNFGYMSRAVNVFRRSETSPYHLDDLLDDETPEEQDPAELHIIPECEAFICHQHVVFSSTFRVPAFYFLVCNSSGAPLSLPDVLRTSLFKISTLDNVEISTYAISLPTSTFPLLSHGDHPTLGTPYWYFHPCETTEAVEELMREVAKDGFDENAKLTRWLELWFMVVCSVVNL